MANPGTTAATDDVPKPLPPAGRPTWREPVLLGAAVTALIVAVTWGSRPWLGMDSSDAAYYLPIAEGRMGDAVKPFANRFLHPTVVRAICTTTGADIWTAYLAVGVGSLFTFVTALLVAFRRTTGRSPAAFAGFLLTSYLVFLFCDYCVPELPHAALLAVFFCLLVHRRHGGAIAVLFVLQLVRESTVLLSAIFVLACLFRGHRRLAAGAVFATALGMAVTAVATRGAGPNIHGMSTPVYLLLKVPFNVSKNVFGVSLWADSLPVLKDQTPQYAWTLPGWLPTGSMRRVGVLGFTIQPAYTLQAALNVLGVLPGLVVLTVLRRRRRLLTGAPLWLVVALAYGLTAFLIGPALGASVPRLMGQGWPAFLVAGPPIILATYRVDRRAGARVLVAHLVAGLTTVAADPAIAWYVPLGPLLGWLQLSVGAAALGFSLWTLGRPIDGRIADIERE